MRLKGYEVGRLRIAGEAKGLATFFQTLDRLDAVGAVIGKISKIAGKVIKPILNTSSKAFKFVLREGAEFIRDTRLMIKPSSNLYCGFPILDIKLIRKGAEFTEDEIKALKSKVDEAINAEGGIEKLPLDENGNRILEIDINGEKTPVILGSEDSLEKIGKITDNLNEFVEGVVGGVRKYNIEGELAKGIKVISRKVSLGNKSMILKWKLVNGSIDFTSDAAKSNLRSQIKNFLGTTSGIDAHHVLPLGKCDHPIVQAAARNGYHPNLPESILGLEHYDEALQVGLHQNHPAYDNFIEFRLNKFMDNGNLSPDACNDFIQKQLIPELKAEIFNAKNSTAKNLNTYFKEVINPRYGIN